MEVISELFPEEELSGLRKAASRAFDSACRYANTFLGEKEVVQLYDQLECQYVEQFWELLGSPGVEKRMDGDGSRLVELGIIHDSESDEKEGGRP